MLPRLSPLLRNPPMALAVSRATPPLPLHTILPATTLSSLHSPSSLSFAPKPSNFNFLLLTNNGHSNKKLKTFSQDNYRCTVWASQRGYREFRRRPAAARRSKKKDLELNVSICIEEGLPNDPEILSIAELLRLNVPTAMKLAFDNLKSSTFKTRDEAITDVGGFDSIELSVMLCNDEFIRKLNKEWRDEDHATDVLSMSQHVPGLGLPFLMLGDIVISAETAARQAEERGHTIIDEIRVLLVHGLLHLLGFDHEISEEAEAEMDKEEQVLLESLGWKGKGLIQSAYDAESNVNHDMESSDGRKKAVLDSINQNSAISSAIWMEHC
ncbi:ENDORIBONUCLEASE YBEY CHLOROPLASTIC [Salix purpurea]|uniref:ENDORIBONUCLEASE YBEY CHLOROPLASTIC n=1 Tax=Salix purpurea TaxID=77065 RepID=A0A9Q0VIL6_SALPP|nr:ENDORIBONUCLEASE YBEY CHLOROPLASTIC [Salix purpurea]KAJ6749300.1 ENDORIBONUCLEASE YBEY CHLOROPLASTIC [Salix purpurea]